MGENTYYPGSCPGTITGFEGYDDESEVDGTIFSPSDEEFEDSVITGERDSQ